MTRQLLSAALAVFSLSAVSQETTTVRFADIADAWVRSNNENWKDGNSFKLEYHAVADNSAFYALLGFDYQLPAGKKVEKATLHFVTERVKGADTSVRGYANDFSDNTTWSAEGSFITSALESAPIFTARLAGQWNKSITDVLNEDYQNIDAWTNTVDVTSYVKSVRGQRVNFLISADDETKTGQNCIYSKEVNSDNSLPSFVADAESLKPILEVVFSDNTDSSTSRILPLADTELRVGNNNKYGDKDQMEIKDFMKDDKSGLFYGLMEYKLPDEIFDTDGYEVQSVTLRLFSKLVKGSRKLNINAYSESVDEQTNYSTVENFMTEALSNEPIASFEAKGQSGKACWDKGLKDEYLTAEAWTNTIDLTDYVKNVISGETRSITPGNIAFVISKAEQDNADNSIRISTKEATDIAANADEHPGVIFSKEDIIPYLTVSYIKKGTTTAITITDENGDNDAPVEFFNLNGIRVNTNNLTPGIYIRRQGEKVTKIFVK